jgi:hypothetical protein
VVNYEEDVDIREYYSNPSIVEAENALKGPSKDIFKSYLLYATKAKRFLRIRMR